MQPWIRSPRYDGVFILMPPFIALLIVMLLPDRYRTTADMPVLSWFLLVVLIDVAHVYSTLFRTYFDRARFRRQRWLFVGVPTICYLVGVGLHSLGAGVFWRALAYLAVFHFVRQQYGFLRLYARSESSRFAWLDTMTIYAATLYPLLIWHLTPNRNFNWFTDGDFWQTDWPLGRQVATLLYVGLLGLYLAKELVTGFRYGTVNRPRNLLVLGTALSWYVGIVYLNGDLAFTLLNVVSHGIPYLALIWLTNPPGFRRRPALAQRAWLRLVLFLGVIIGLAYLEEGIWDGLVWREHGAVFGTFQALPTVQSEWLLALLVPLLALPQATHYVLDGFIWRRDAGTAT
ncbi:hypothetical protein GGR92_003145 [Spirosoma lacussanchae]|uniref:hypothetical protein n=1 Tax=Spirosoma lacussanchae TaxID=1884249 RepID=UPI001108DAEE|nr:hypothetical protein [Spirosoma lacussanchae]